jgi:hypothetical protein
MTSALQGKSYNIGRKNGIAEYTFIKERLELGENLREIYNAYKEKGYIEGSDLTPSFQAISKMAYNIAYWPWTVEEFVNNSRTNNRWSLEEDIVLKQWYKQKGSEWKKLAIALNEANPIAKRTFNAITGRGRLLNLSSSIASKFKWDPEKLAGTGLKLQDGFEVKRSAGVVQLECIKKGHKFERDYNNLIKRNTGVGCPICNGTNHDNEFLSEDYFVRYPEKKVEPCYIYQVNFPQFERPTTKPGRAKDWQIRVASYPEHELYNLRLLTLYDVFKLERIFQDKFGNYRTNPEELKGNGITEGFDLSIKDKIADIIDKYESYII